MRVVATKSPETALLNGQVTPGSYEQPGDRHQAGQLDVSDPVCFPRRMFLGRTGRVAVRRGIDIRRSARARRLLDANTENARFEDESPVDDSLSVEEATGLSEDLLLTQQDHALSGNHGAPESDVVDGTEPKKTLTRHYRSAVEGTELRCRFEHEDPWKNGPARNMASHPKLVLADVPQADDHLLRRAEADDGGQLLKFVPVRVDLANVLKGVLDMFEV